MSPLSTHYQNALEPTSPFLNMDAESPLLLWNMFLIMSMRLPGQVTIFPDEKGKPILHMHMTCGRKTSSVTGCVRKGVKVWHVMEVILFELVDTTAVRAFEPATGFELLRP